jgi:hypothetical protein
LNSVRNRVLEFAIAVWKEAPNFGEKPGTAQSVIAGERATQIFHTVVYGGAANVFGTADSSTISITNTANDWASLRELLTRAAVSTQDTLELRAALDAEPTALPDKQLGPRVSDWIADMMRKAASGTWKISLGAAGNLLARAIGAYYGV